MCIRDRRHAGQSQEVLREEQQVHEHHGPPEMHLGPELAVHAARPLRPPVIDCGDDREQRAGDQHVMEAVSYTHLDVYKRQGTLRRLQRMVRDGQRHT